MAHRRNLYQNFAFHTWLTAQEGREDSVGELARRLKQFAPTLESDRFAGRTFPQAIKAIALDKVWPRAILASQLAIMEWRALGKPDGLRIDLS